MVHKRMSVFVALAAGSIHSLGLRAEESCPADLTNDGTLDFFDIAAFLTAFTNQDPIADFTNNGTFDFFDISAFLTAFSAGCP
ncbi:MAG: hypothetical protein JKY43_08915 [Phycisphaerales bacterium]|nr:hypothetical protein [Phycisphaerales bacterium]